MSPTELDTITEGTPVYAIDDRQNTVPGTFKARRGAHVIMYTDHGEREFHARYVVVDHWRSLRDLP